MDFNINIRVEVTPEFCKALDNIANTITAAFCVTAASQMNTQTQERPAEIAAPMEEAPKQPPAPKEKKPEPEEPATDFKALRAELKSVMAKAAKEGKAEAVKALLAELGVSKLSQIPDDALEGALKKAGDI